MLKAEQTAAVAHAEIHRLDVELQRLSALPPMQVQHASRAADKERNTEAQVQASKLNDMAEQLAAAHRAQNDAALEVTQLKQYVKTLKSRTHQMSALIRVSDVV